MLGGAPLSQAPVFDNASLKLNRQMHVAELDVGYRWGLLQGPDTRFHAGARLVQFRQDTAARANGHSSFFGVSSVVTSFENKGATFFGGGPRVGVDGFQSVRQRTHGVSPIGGVSGPIIFGRSNNEVGQTLNFIANGVPSSSTRRFTDDDNGTIYNFEGYLGASYNFPIGGMSGSLGGGFRAETGWHSIDMRGRPATGRPQRLRRQAPRHSCCTFLLYWRMVAKRTAMRQICVMNSGDDSDGLRRAGHAQQHADAAMGIVRPRFSSSGADLPAPVGAISYRPYAAGDERSMMAGFNESFGLNRGLDYWRWKHDRPAMASTIMLAVDETNAVQAQFAAMPFDWRMDGTTLRVGFVGDNFARRHPRLVRQNVFLRTIRAFHRQHAEAGGFAFLYGIPNEVVRRLHNVLLPSLGPHPVPYFLRRLDTGPHAPLPHGWRAQSRTPNADDVENLWLRTEAAYPRGAARNASWLNWRFVRRPDVVDYRFLHVMDPNGRVQAWAVLRQQGHTMWVCDLLWDHAQPLSLTALDAAIAKASIAAGAHANSMWFQGDAAGEILLSVHGWQPTPNPYPENLCFVVYDRQTDYTDLQRKVYFTLADSDHI